mgnify:FL=1
MKHKLTSIGCLPAMLLLLGACMKQPHAASLLRQTDSLLLQGKPDSALQLLHSLTDETVLTEAERMKLIWNRAMAHYKQEMSLLEDSQLYQAVAYYRQRGDTAAQLETYLLEGMYLRWKEANDEAIAVFDRGISLAIARKDTANMLVLQRKKLEVLYKQSRFMECKAMIEDMLRIAHKLPVKEHYQMVYSLALVSQLGGDTSNMACHEKGFQLAMEAGDTAFAYHILNNYGVALMLDHQYKASLALYHRLIRLYPSSISRFMIPVNFGLIYLDLKMNDSASYYIRWTERLIDSMQMHSKGRILLGSRGSVNQMRTVLDERMGKPIEKLKFVRYCDSIQEDLLAKHNTALRQQETRAQLEQRNYKLIISRQKMELRIAVVVSLLLGVILLLIIIYQQNLKKKERTIRRLSEELQQYNKQLKDNEVLIAQNNEHILELQMQLSLHKADEQEEQRLLIGQLEEQNRKLTLANRDLQQQIETHWHKLKSNPLKTQPVQELTTEMLRLKDREEELSCRLIAAHPLVASLRSTPRFLQPEDFVRLSVLVDEVYPKFTDRLTAAFPNLTELDIQLCILIKLGFSISQIAVFTAVSSTSVSQQKSRMKKRMLQHQSDIFAEKETLDLWLHRF